MFEKTLQEISPLNVDAIAKAKARLDILTKPLGSLGVLEDIAAQLAGITGNPLPTIAGKAVIVMAGDHGVAEEGVSAFPKEVTYQMVMNFVAGGAAINVLARHEGVKVVVVDIGVDADIDSPGVLVRKVKRGTNNMCKGPAMSREEAVAAIEAGIQVVSELVEQGVDLFATGEMGIANTTASSAILSVLGGFSPDEVVGRGTGVNDKGLERKIEALKKALEVNNPDPSDALDVLAKVGGLEIAGLVGCILGAAANRKMIVIDGFISTAAALVASRLAPGCSGYMVGSHASAEQAHKKMLSAAGLKPMLQLDMRLGEGTGAVLAMNIIEAATKVINEMATFESAGVSSN